MLFNLQPSGNRSRRASSLAPLDLRAAVCFFALVLLFLPASPAAQDQPATFDSLAKSAAAARDAGRAGEALANYQRAVELRPDWQEGWFYIGTLQYDADRYADAIPAFQKLVELAPNTGAAWNFLGLCEFATRDYANARTHLEKGQKLGAGDDPEIGLVLRYHLALLLIRDGEFDRATKMLVSAFRGQGQFPAQAKLALGLALLHAPVLPDELDPSREALVRAAGEIAVYLEQNDSAKALDAIRPVLEEYPVTPYLHAARAKALAAAGQKEHAQAEQKKEVAVVKDLPLEQSKRLKALRSLYVVSDGAANATNLPADPDAVWNSAMDAYSSGKYSDAVAALKIWVERRPAERKSNDGTGWAVMGLSEFELKNYDNALIHLQRGQDLGLGGSPDAVRLARYRLGTLLNRAGQHESAARLLAPESGSDSLAAEIQFALGLSLLRMPVLPEQVPASQRALVQNAGEIEILLQASKYDEAFPKLQHLLKQNPETPFLHYTYGMALASLSQYDEAEPQLREEARISPNSELPYVLLASIALRKHNTADALPVAVRAVSLAPNSARARYVLGRVYLESNQEEKAVRELEAANKINPGSPEIHFNLAKAYAKTKHPEKAAQEREIFARLNAEAEEQRSRTGNQSIGTSSNAIELSPAASSAPREQQ